MINDIGGNKLCRQRPLNFVRLSNRWPSIVCAVWWYFELLKSAQTTNNQQSTINRGSLNCSLVWSTKVVRAHRIIKIVNCVILRDLLLLLVNYHTQLQRLLHQLGVVFQERLISANLVARCGKSSRIHSDSNSNSSFSSLHLLLFISQV